MENIGNRFSKAVDNSMQFLANKKAKAGFFNEIDADQDGKITNKEVLAHFDSDSDGYIDASELEQMALKAAAADVDETTLKAMAQSANQSQQVTLFEAEAEAQADTEATAASPESAQAEDESILPESVQGMIQSVKNYFWDNDESEAAASETSTENAQAASSSRKSEDVVNWTETEAQSTLEESYRTAIPYRREALDSRDNAALEAVEPGLFRVQDQVGNSCGTTSLSMLMKYYQGHTLENSVNTIDSYIRGRGSFSLPLPTGVQEFDVDTYTAPQHIVQYARDHGFRAGMDNNSSLSDIKSFIDQGVPVLALTDWNFDGGTRSRPADANPDGKSLHYVNIVGYEYEEDDAGEQALHLLIANPHGRIQSVHKDEFLKVWSDLHLAVGSKMIDSDMNRLLVAMVPTDDDFPMTAPNGEVFRAGDISISDDSVGIRGWITETASEVIQAAVEVQERVARRGAQLNSEVSAGYEEGGVLGALNNLWNGDANALAELKAEAEAGTAETKAQIINELLNKGINREGIQDLVYEILKDADWGSEFDQILAAVDATKLANRLQNSRQAGKVLAWIAKSEVDARGNTGPKFEAFLNVLANDHRDSAIRHFLDNQYTQEHKLLQKAPASVVRGTINKLLSGITDSAEERTIYRLLKATSWSQFDAVVSRLDMSRVADELSSTSDKGNLLSWTIQSAIKTDNWGPVNEMLNELEGWEHFETVDNLLGLALDRDSLRGKLGEIPAHYRRRFEDLLDDRLRWRSDKAINALRALRRL